MGVQKNWTNYDFSCKLDDISVSINQVTNTFNVVLNSAETEMEAILMDNLSAKTASELLECHRDAFTLVLIRLHEIITDINTLAEQLYPSKGVNADG